MSDDGYTLVETLAALAMIGLALGGLAVSVGVLGKGQRDTNEMVADLQASRQAESLLSDALQRGAPFRSADAGSLVGDANSMVFACGEAEPCRAGLRTGAKGLSLHLETAERTRDLPLRQAGPAHFQYGGVESIGELWPPVGFGRQALQGVSLNRADGAPILSVRLWVEQPEQCVFDTVIQDCR